MTKSKKIISLLLALVIVIGVLPMNVFATNSYDQDYTGEMGTQVSYTGQGTEEYTVTVPATMAPGDTGNVSVSGTWASNKKLIVSADSTVTLTNSLNSAEQKTIDITFAGIAKTGSNTNAIATTDEGAFATISIANWNNDVTAPLFGTWSGTFYYNVEMRSNTSNRVMMFAVRPKTQVSGFDLLDLNFEFESWMTWRDFVNSKYNDNEFFIKEYLGQEAIYFEIKLSDDGYAIGGHIAIDDGSIDGVLVYPDDKIDPDIVYRERESLLVFIPELPAIPESPELDD